MQEVYEKDNITKTKRERIDHPVKNWDSKIYTTLILREKGSIV